MITAVTDYTGKYQLSKGMFDTAKLQEYIDRYEPRYLKELFGVELYNDFSADLVNGVPQSENFVKVFDALSEDIGSYFYAWNNYRLINTIIDSEGIKELLKGFIYFEYSKDLINQMTPYGNVKPMAENSEVTNTLFSLIYTRYNEAVRTYNAIQEYIVLNQTKAFGQVQSTINTVAGTGYITAAGVSCLNGSGIGCLVDITAEPIGGVNVLPTLLTVGSGYSTQTEVPVITTGSGTGLLLNIYDDGAGAIDYFDVFEQGEGYEIGDILTIDAGNQDATIEVIGVSNGEITALEVTSGGQAYLVGDVLTVDAGNADATFEVSFVGSGDFRKFKGVRKSFNYWL